MDPRLLVPVFGLLASGCSLLSMTRPPPMPLEPEPRAECTTSRLAPALDTAGAVVFGVPGLVTTGYGIATPVCTGWCLFQPETPGAKAAIIGVGAALVGVAVLQAISAGHGYGWASHCEEIRELQLACKSGVEASCTKLRAPSLRMGKDLGAHCSEDAECSAADTCQQGRCLPRPSP